MTPSPPSESTSPIPHTIQSLWKADWMVWIVGAIAALLCCGLALALPVPDAVTQLLRTSRPVVPLVFLVGLWLSFRQSNRWEPFVSLGLVLLLFSMPLVVLWNTGQSSLGALGGLLPWTDSGIYFRLAHGLLDGQEISLGYARPFFLGLLTVVFGLTQRSLMATQVILTGIAAIAVYLASRELRQVYGALLPAFCVVGVYLFYAPHIGSLMTENIGIALGVLSLAVLWRGAARLHPRTVLVGIFLLTMALCSRMGALLVLPLLVVWGSFWFRRSPRPGHRSLPFSLSFAVQGFAAILLGLVLNSVLARLLSSQTYIPFGNYSFVLYGLLKGGNWRTIFEDYPAVLQGQSPTESARLGFQICLEYLRQHPFSLIKGCLRALVTLPLQGSRLLLPQFVTQPLYGILLNSLVRPGLLMGLLACGLFWRRSPLAGLLLALLLGTLTSAPLAPVWDAGLRPYAVTIMAYYALLILGLIVLWQWLRHWKAPLSQKLAATYAIIQPERAADGLSPLPQNRSERLARFGLVAPAIVALLLCVTFLVGPLGVRAIASPVVAENFACPANAKAQLLHLNPQSALHIVTPNEAPHTRLPSVVVSDFRRGLKRLSPLPGLAQTLGKVDSGSSLLLSRRNGLVIMPTQLMPVQVGHYKACGQYKTFTVNKFAENEAFMVEALSPAQ